MQATIDKIPCFVANLVDYLQVYVPEPGQLQVFVVTNHHLESKRRGVMFRTPNDGKYGLVKWDTIIEGKRNGADKITFTWTAKDSLPEDESLAHLDEHLHLPLTIRDKPILLPLIRPCVWRLLATCRTCLAQAGLFQSGSHNPRIQHSTDYISFCKYFLGKPDGLEVLSLNNLPRHFNLSGNFDLGTQCQHWWLFFIPSS